MLLLVSLLSHPASANGGSAGSIPDEAMQTGGGTFAPPGGVVVFGTPTVAGRIKMAAVEEAIVAGAPRIRYCYERQRVKAPSLAGELVVDLVIGTDGTATSTTKSSTLGAPEVEACVNTSLSHLDFPKAKGGPATVTYPFTFVPPAQ